MTSHTLPPQQPIAYFDRMIEDFDAEVNSRNTHLGHWDLDDDAPRELSNSITCEEFEQAQERLNHEMIRRAHVVRGSNVLDVACGFGGLIETLDKQFTDLQLTGLNIDARQLEICQQLRSKSVNSMRWHEADACDLPFEDATFDIVFCIEAMFHFGSRKQFLAEARRVLKTGGSIVLTDIVLLRDNRMPMFCFDAILNGGYGPWPDPWCDTGNSRTVMKASKAWNNIQQMDASLNTLPSYNYIMPEPQRSHRAPEEVTTRSAMLLQWLHTNHLLRYEYTSAVAGDV